MSTSHEDRAADYAPDSMRALKRALRASIFDRKVNTELFFDSDATADAVLLVSGISAVVYVGISVLSPIFGFSVTGLLQAIIASLIAWLILAAGTWVAATKLFDGTGQIQTMMRLHGHCELPLLLAFLGPGGAVAGLLWSVAAKVPATSEGASLETVKSLAAVLIGLALMVLIQMIFRLPFLAFSSLF